MTKYKVARGVSQFKKRQAQSEVLAKTVAIKRASAKKGAMAKLQAKAARAARLRAREKLLATRADEVASRRMQGQTSDQIAQVTGIPVALVRKLLRSMKLRP